MVNTLEWDLRGALRLIDQRRLPTEEKYVTCRTHREVAEAIGSMVVRGAPAIGVAAAYGMVLAASESAMETETARPVSSREFLRRFQQAGALLEASRPTAVNLAWAANRMVALAKEAIASEASVGEVLRLLEAEAELIHDEDVITNRRLGVLGAALVRKGDNVLTHCNAGGLATGGYGTAVGVIRRAWELTRDIHVYVDETRPLFQGSRLTAWELAKEGIPVTVITDSSAGWLMQQKKLDIIFVGADRIAANGDVANKIGTYSLAVLARENKVPFYVVAPTSTVDLQLESGAEIPIEQRDPTEVTNPAGQRVTPEGVPALNYAFDVTPARLITGIITEAGIARHPYSSSLRRRTASQ